MTTPITYEASPSDLVREAEIAERDRIVAWLRSHEASGLEEPFEEAARYIERGGHLGPDEFVRVQRGSLEHDPKEWK